jgi:hypothetical protein
MFLWVLVVVYAVLSSGCPPTLHMILYNHVGADLSVGTEGELVLLLKESSGRFVYRTDSRGLKIKNVGTEWIYDLPIPPREYLQLARWTGYEITCQIEPDGGIYLLKPGIVPPASELTQQPEGFPLKPK